LFKKVKVFFLVFFFIFSLFFFYILDLGVEAQKRHNKLEQFKKLPKHNKSNLRVKWG